MPVHIFKIFLILVLLALAPASANAALVNINTADSTELQTLNGIGPSKAQAIIDYRNGPNGPFETIEEIKNVSGIGDVTYNNIKDFITVSDISSPQLENSTSESTSNTSSVHYGSTPISNVDKRVDVYVSAGRNRAGTVGSPMEFMAETDFDYTKSSIFSWNFGDGSTGSGNIITHTYDYPGEYTVILTVVSPQGQAVSRVDVKITDPALEITLASPQRIELKNNSKEEVNLYGRALWSGNKAFLFPKDTIIKAGQKISFGSKVTGLSPNTVNDVQSIVIGDTEQPKIGQRIAEEKMNKIADLQNQLALLKQQMASIAPPAPHLAVQPPSEPSSEKSVVEKLIEPEEIEVAESQTAIAKDGWLGFFKRFFLRTK